MKILYALLACILLVGCSLDRNTMNFKFITSGQSADNVPVFSQVIHGNSLKPLSPANVRGSRNAAGDLLIEWTRRSRIGSGLRPDIGVPLGEEGEQYVVEIYSGSTLVRSTNVFVDLGSPVLWQQIQGTPATIGADGTVTTTTNDVVLVSQQKVHGDFVYEQTVPVTGTYNTPRINLRVVPTADAVPSLIWGMEGLWVPGISAPRTYFDSFNTYPIVTGDRLMMESRGGVISYYQNYSGRTSVPLYVSRVVINQADSYYITLSTLSDPSSSQIVTPRLYRFLPESLYTTGQQTQDFGSIQSSIKIRVKQISAVVGAGPYTEATL